MTIVDWAPVLICVIFGVFMAHRYGKVKDMLSDTIFDGNFYFYSFISVSILSVFGASINGLPDNFLIGAKLLIVASICPLTLISVNKKYFGLKFIIPIGATMNFAAYLFNGWRMPSQVGTCLQETAKLAPSGSHQIADVSANLPWLIDRFAVGIPHCGQFVVLSIGDILMICGFALWIVQLEISHRKMIRSSRPAGS